MSHIPSAAMPHAKPHEPVEEPTVQVPAHRTDPAPLPWAAIALGGVLAIGGAAAAVLLTRGSKPARRKPAKRGAKRSGTRKAKTAASD